MIKVLVESPFSAKTKEEFERNKRYARLCLRDCFLRGEAPFASHLLYTQPGVLNDAVLEERQLGIDAGLMWGIKDEKSVFYSDFGFSRGMEYGLSNAKKSNRPIEYRNLPSNLMCMLDQTQFDKWAW